MPNRFERRTSRVFQAICADALQRLVDGTAGVHSACLVTSDGLPVASVLRDGVSADRLAAMTSSLHALGEAIAREHALEECQSVIVNGASGALIVIRTGTSETSFTLAAVCDTEATLGSVYFAAREQAVLITTKLNAATGRTT
jgi:uncharacterized protein